MKIEHTILALAKVGAGHADVAIGFSRLAEKLTGHKRDVALAQAREHSELGSYYSGMALDMASEIKAHNDEMIASLQASL